MVILTPSESSLILKAAVLSESSERWQQKHFMEFYRCIGDARFRPISRRQSRDGVAIPKSDRRLAEISYLY